MTEEEKKKFEEFVNSLPDLPEFFVTDCEIKDAVVVAEDEIPF